MPTQAPRRIGSPLLVVLSILLGLLLIAFGLFAGVSKRYQSRFLPGSTVNGVDVSGMTVSQAERALEDSQGDYALTLIERDSVTETITGEEIDLTLTFNGKLEEQLNEQNHWAWPLAALGGRSYRLTVETMVC